MSPIVTMTTRPHQRVRYTAAGGGGGGGVPAWRAATRATSYTPPTGIDTYGTGTVLDTTWNLAGQTGTTHTCTTQGQVTTALGAANPGDKIVISANIVAPSGGWNLGNRGTGTIYIVSDYINASTFERSASVSDWSTLTEAEWATAVSASRARTTDTYRILDSYTGSGGDEPVFVMTVAKSTYWVIAGFDIRANPSDALTGTSINYGLIRIDSIGTNDATTAGRLWIDRCYIHANATQNLRRALALNGSECAVTNSCITEVHDRNQSDNQCIAKWSGGAKCKIINNTLTGTGQIIMFGGSGNNQIATIPADIEVRANYMGTPVGMLNTDATHGSSAWAGCTYTGKVLMEQKFGIRTWWEGNYFHHARGTFGYAWMLQSLTEGAGDPWNHSEDTAYRQNRILTETGGVEFAGRGAGGYATTPMQGVHVLDLLMTGVTSGTKGILTDNMGSIEMYGVTIDGSSINSAFAVSGTGTALGNFTVNGMAAPGGTYGVIGNGTGVGDAAMDAYPNGTGYTASVSNFKMWGSGFSAGDFNGSCPATIVADQASMGFDNAGANDWDIPSVTNSCNATLVRALTDSLNVESYS